MLPRPVSRRPLLLLLRSAAPRSRMVQRRTMVAAPKPGDGPLMERRPDRELPDVEKTGFRWSRTLPLFAVVIALSSAAIFNYQKISSPVVASTLYALRTSDKARAYLGDEIYFKQQIPWISGEMNQLHGRIDVRFAVRGTRNEAVMRFASFRPTPRGMFETTEWSLETAEGDKIDLLEGNDIFRGIQVAGGAGGALADDGLDDAEEEHGVGAAAAATRGFRQMNKK